MLNKISVQLVVKDGFPPITRETLLGERLTEDTFKIEKIPFYSTELNLNDIVLVKKLKKEERIADVFFEFVKVVKYSGNRTLRVIFLNRDEAYREQCIANLEQFNCSWESMKEGFFLAFNVPKEATLDKILNLMDEGFSEGFLDYQFV